MLRFLLTCALSLCCVASSLAAPETAETLTAKVPENVQRGFEILQRVRRESKDKDYSMRASLSAELAPYDVNLASQLAGDEGATADMENAFVVSRLAQRDPQRAAQLVVPQLKKISDVKARLMATFLVGPQLTKIAPDLAAQIVQQFDALPQQGALDAQGVFYQLFAGALEADPKAARVRFQYALDEANNLAALDENDEASSGLVAALIEGIAMFDPEMAAQAALDLPVAQSIRPLSHAIVAIAPQNLDLALSLLERIPVGMSAQELAGAADNTKPHVRNDEPDWAFGVAAKAIIPELGKKDPAAAQALAERVSSPSYRGDALVLAAQFLDAQTTTKLYDEAVAATLTNTQASYEHVTTISRYAAQLVQRYQQPGLDLFEQAQQLMEKHRAQDPLGATDDVAGFAFYRAALDTAQSRALLENEWKRLQAQKALAQNLSTIARAMSAVDIDRALEMARSLDEDFWRFDTQRKIAQYVLAPDEVRHDLPFRRWGAADNWQPGTPT